MDALPVPASRPAGLGAGRLRTILVLAVVAIVVIAAAWFVDQPSGGSNVRAGEAPAGAPPRVGDAPPDFQATAIDGTAVSMAALKGQPTWLTFGASWCPDCRAEATDLQATYAKYRPQGLAVLGVFIEEDRRPCRTTRRGSASPSRWSRTRRARSPTCTRTYGIPIHFFVGRDGMIQDVRIGRLTPSDMEQLVQQLVNG